MAELSASGEAPPLGFEPSKLGTIEHWESVYRREVAMHKEIGDEGEVWFGEDAAEEMKDWAEEHCPPSEHLQILDSQFSLTTPLHRTAHSHNVPRTSRLREWATAFLNARCRLQKSHRNRLRYLFRPAFQRYSDSARNLRRRFHRL